MFTPSTRHNQEQQQQKQQGKHVANSESDVKQSSVGGAASTTTTTTSTSTAATSLPATTVMSHPPPPPPHHPSAAHSKRVGGGGGGELAVRDQNVMSENHHHHQQQQQQYNAYNDVPSQRYIHQLRMSQQNASRSHYLDDRSDQENEEPAMPILTMLPPPPPPPPPATSSSHHHHHHHHHQQQQQQQQSSSSFANTLRVKVALKTTVACDDSGRLPQHAPSAAAPVAVYCSYATNGIAIKRGCDDVDGETEDDATAASSSSNSSSSACSSSMGYGRRSPPKKPKFIVTYKEMREFFELLEEESIREFLKRDVCCLISDKYALAMVFTYFKRAKFYLNEFTRINFYLALYLASDIEEDVDEYKYEIFPWALGGRWRSKFNGFLRKRDALLKRIGYRAIVSRKCCEEVMSLMPENPAWKRERSEDHGGATRAYLISKSRRNYSNRVDASNPSGASHGAADDAELNLPRGPHENPRPCPLCLVNRAHPRANAGASDCRQLQQPAHHQLHQATPINQFNPCIIRNYNSSTSSTSSTSTATSSSSAADQQPGVESDDANNVETSFYAPSAPPPSLVAQRKKSATSASACAEPSATATTTNTSTTTATVAAAAAAAKPAINTARKHLKPSVDNNNNNNNTGAENVKNANHVDIHCEGTSSNTEAVKCTVDVSKLPSANKFAKIRLSLIEYDHASATTTSATAAVEQQQLVDLNNNQICSTTARSDPSAATTTTTTNGGGLVVSDANFMFKNTSIHNYQHLLAAANEPQPELAGGACREEKPFASEASCDGGAEASLAVAQADENDDEVFASVYEAKPTMVNAPIKSSQLQQQQQQQHSSSYKSSKQQESTSSTRYNAIRKSYSHQKKQRSTAVTAASNVIDTTVHITANHGVLKSKQCIASLSVTAGQALGKKPSYSASSSSTTSFAVTLTTTSDNENKFADQHSHDRFASNENILFEK